MILDTNAVSALAVEDVSLIAVLGSAQRHHLPVIVLGEYEFGLAGSRHRRELEKWLEALAAESIVLTVDRETARLYAEIASGLKRAGTPIPANDVWIASLALQHDLLIVSRDTHFDAVKQVRRVKW